MIVLGIKIIYRKNKNMIGCKNKNKFIFETVLKKIYVHSK
jgi:hypothetical protein